MNQIQLFLDTIKDLGKKSVSNEPYDLVLISGLIFKLLYDSPSLISQVNSSKIKIEFKINNRDPFSALLPELNNALTFWSPEDGLDPETSIPHLSNPIIVNKDGLYKHRVLIVEGRNISLGELIKFIRNVKGGVHVGPPKEEQLILAEIQKNFFIGGHAAGLHSMKAIARIVIKGLKPLQINLGNTQK